MSSEQKEYDSPEDRYQKVKEVVQSYTAIQFGIVPFTWDEKAKEYLARPFNFYTFPISRDHIRDSTHKGGADTIAFLAKNNFDFNKLFSGSINYARKSEFAEVYEKCVYRVGKYFPDNRSHEALSMAHEVELEEHMTRIKEWVYDPASEMKLTFTINSLGLRKYLDKKIMAEFKGTGVFFKW